MNKNITVITTLFIIVVFILVHSSYLTELNRILLTFDDRSMHFIIMSYFIVQLIINTFSLSFIGGKILDKIQGKC